MVTQSIHKRGFLADLNDHLASAGSKALDLNVRGCEFVQILRAKEGYSPTLPGTTLNGIRP